MAKRKKKKRHYFGDGSYEILGLSPETKQGIIAVLLLLVGLLSVLSFFDMAGMIGSYVNFGLSLAFGWVKFIFPVAAVTLAYLLFRSDKYFVSGMNYFGLIAFFLSFNGLVHLSDSLDKIIELANAGQGGGWVGVVLTYPLVKFASFWAALIILIALFLISILITFNTTFENMAMHSKFFAWPIKAILFPFKKVFGLIRKGENGKGKEETKDEDEEVEEEEEEEIVEEVDVKSKKKKGIFKKKKNSDADVDDFQGVITSKHRKKIDVPLDLLNDKKETPTAIDVESTKDKIAKTFENFNIDVEMGECNVGPTVTQYTMRPADGVKLTRITSLGNDLSLALAAYPIRIEAPIPGQSMVGVEVPNKAVATVGLRELIESKAFKKAKSQLALSIGKDVKGKSWVADLDTMPHLLIAGSTGSGKSVCINTIIISLLYQNGPDDLKFIMVDPKRVELTCYNDIPHLITPVITEAKKTVNALKWCLNEMDRRFELLSKCGHRNIATHNANAETKLPYIVFIIDELADLMAVAASDVEAAIIRLAQMARAVGIHLILATQRPSVDVITGLIKANITSRIAFSVASLMDSRTILDTSGAEKLIGKGDMLYGSAQLSKPKRLQGAYVSDDEIKRVVSFLKEQGDGPDYTDDIVEKQKDPITSFEANDDDDELLEEAKELVIRAGKASASYLQRRLRIGYARAARLLDLLEERGIIGPSNGAKPRELLVGEEALSIEQSYGEVVEEEDGVEEGEEDEDSEEEEEEEK